ncbi:MAG: ABC transporter, partial [Alphaproteobacteria bacterium]|nr:ABC transporter [Alphaproteobacteria bacterium]
MTTAIQFILIGLSVGAIYALGAAGMIVVYRGSGIINFASGAVGMVGAYAFWILHDNDGWGFTEAFILSIALCMAIGLAVQLLVMHPLRSSSPLTRLLATLGVLTTLSSLVSIKYPEQAQVVSSSLPVRAVHIWSISIGIDRLAII